MVLCNTPEKNKDTVLEKVKEHATQLLKVVGSMSEGGKVTAPPATEKSNNVEKSERQ